MNIKPAMKKIVSQSNSRKISIGSTRLTNKASIPHPIATASGPTPSKSTDKKSTTNRIKIIIDLEKIFLSLIPSLAL